MALVNKEVAQHFLLFETKEGNVHLYDAPTNTVHPWNRPLNTEFAAKLYAAPDSDLEALVGSVYPDEHRKQGMLVYICHWRGKSAAFRNAELPSTLSFRKLGDVPLEKRGPVWMSDLVLIPSEGCNLRCAYCSYSSFYPSYRRHSKDLMHFDVARKAIDWFYLYNDAPAFHSYPDRNLNIVFYGGEALLNFDVIRRAILHAEKAKREHYGLVLSISTNLTLFKEEYLPFLRQHDVFINVSLDGPPEEHDRYRRFPNGRPTSKRVLGNLQKIRRFDESYYFNRVRLLPTLNGNSNAWSIYKYFETIKGELPPFLMVNLLKDLPFSEFHRAHPYDLDIFAQGINRVLDSYVEQKLLGKHFFKGEFFYHVFEEALNNIFMRVQTSGYGSPKWYTGTCLPGRKLAVNPKGLFHMCERINEHFPIGDVEKGLDEEQIRSIVNLYFENLPGCHQCWARNLCTMCYAAVCDKGYFDFEQRCQLAREAMKANLSLLFSILEKRQGAFLSKDRLINVGNSAQGLQPLERSEDSP